MKGETTPADPGAAATGAMPRLSPVAAMVRRHDPDRYKTALFARSDRREALFTLYAFNYEVARVRESVTTPMLGQIRLQWWREVVDMAYAEAPPRTHLVAAPLTAAIRDFGLTRERFDRLIDAREADLADEPPATQAVLEAYAEATSSNVIRLALEILGNRPDVDRRLPAGDAAEAAAFHVGIAYALAGLLRAMPFHARSGRCYIAAEIAAASGLDPVDYAEQRASPAVRQAAAAIGAAAAGHLQAARRYRTGIPRALLPALLPAIVAERALARLRKAGWNPFDPRVGTPEPLLTWRLAGALLRRSF